MAFSGESLRINGRGLLFGLVVGLLVGVWGGLFARLLGRRTTCGRAPDGRYSCCPWPACWWCGCTAGAASKRPGNRPYHPGCPGEQPVSRLLAPVIFAATLLTHGFGDRPAGRGGPAAGGSLAELVRKGESWGPSFRTWRSCAV
ncbi:MAG: hypothetical protein ACLR1T_16735 [Evtepia gabavorous]